VSLQTCNSDRVDNGGNDQVGQGEVGDENAPHVVSGGSPAANLLDDDRCNDDEVAESSNDDWKP